EEIHHGLAGAQVAVACQELDQPHAAKLLLAGRGQVSGREGFHQPMINGPGEVVATAYRAAGAEGQGGQQVLVAAPRDIEGAPVGTQTELKGHEVRVAEL